MSTLRSINGNTNPLYVCCGHGLSELIRPAEWVRAYSKGYDPLCKACLLPGWELGKLRVGRRDRGEAAQHARSVRRQVLVDAYVNMDTVAVKVTLSCLGDGFRN